MKVAGITTKTIQIGDNIFEVLAESISSLSEKQVVVITSKIISLCEGAVVAKSEVRDKYELVKAESDFYTEPTESKYGLSLTIKHKHLSLNAGIDESNADGMYALLPQNPQKTANEIRSMLCKNYDVQEIGVVIIDSIPFPLKWGQTARSLAHSGFLAINNRVGEIDLFGKEIEMTYMSIVEGIAAAAHLEMGEVAERRPVAIVSDIPDIHFQKRNPTEAELELLEVSRVDDAFAPLLDTNKWKQGGGGYFAKTTEK